MQSATRYTRIGWLYASLFTGLPIAIMVWAWVMGAVNVPKWDDHAFKGFLVALERETGPVGVFKLFVKQHNEHRIAYDRVLVWLDNAVFGKLSFKRLMAYGDLSLLGLIALLGAVLARHTRWWAVFLPPIALFVISLAQWENFYWALSSIQNFSIVFWVMWSLYALTHREKPGFAIGLATVATLVSGNGFLVWPCGVVVLVAQKRYSWLIHWVTAALLLIIFYFWDYTQPNTHPPAIGATILDRLAAGLAFLGSAADALPFESGTFWPCVGLGVGLVVYWSFVCSRLLSLWFKGGRLSTLEAFVLGGLAFMVSTTLVVVVGRLGYGRESLLTSRYRIYSLTLLAITYLYIALKSHEQRTWQVAIAGLVVSGLFWWSAFVIYTHESLYLRRSLLTSQYNWTYTTNKPLAALDSVTSRLIDNAPAYYDPLLPTLFATPTAAPIRPDSIYKAGQAYVVRFRPDPSRQTLPDLANPDAGYTLLLRSAQRTYLYSALPEPRRHWRVLLGLLPRYSAENAITVTIPGSELEPGTYDIACIACEKAGTCTLRPTNRLLTVAPHQPATGPEKNW